MSNIQKTLEALQPYVIGIRYLKGQPLVDVVLTEGWTLPEDSKIIRTKGDESMNYHMIHSETVGLDELLGYVDRTIKVNLDREKKHELLKTKVNQLKEIFKKNTLSKLEKLTFTFSDDDFMTNMSDIDISIDSEPIPEVKQVELAPKNETFIEEMFDDTINHPEETGFLDEDGRPIEMSEEDRELAEEEARAERNLKTLENRKGQKSSNIKKVELPKRKLEMTNMDYGSDCECSDSEACEKCIDRKDF